MPSQRFKCSQHVQTTPRNDNEIFMSGMMHFVPLFYREARARRCSKTLQLRHMQDTDTGYEQGIFELQFSIVSLKELGRQYLANCVVSCDRYLKFA